jgi:hypothetical protein
MEKLRTLYLWCLRLWFLALASIYAAWPRFAPRFIEWVLAFFLPAPDVAAWVAWLEGAVSVSTFGLIFVLGEGVIRRYLWRLPHWVPVLGNNELSYHGHWYGETLYETIEQAGTSKPAEVPFRRTHDVRIIQDCFDIRIGTTAGANFTTWKSLAATVDSDGIFRFLYEVVYSDRDRFPKDVHGYEWLAPYRRRRGDKGLPLVIFGGFGHVVDSNPPTYSGQTLFIRKGYGKQLTVEDLPEPFRAGTLSETLASGNLK